MPSRRNQSSGPHRRRNALTGEWVLVSPGRLSRPWLGHQQEPVAEPGLRYDPACYLCPGNARAAGARNPAYEHTLVFDNDFPGLHPADTPGGQLDSEPLLMAEAVSGICRVICFSPRHDVHLATMTAADIQRVVEVWAEQSAELAAIPWIRHVQLFENRGALMGASNPHPHGQIWADASLPTELAKEVESQEAHLAARGTCLLCHYLAIELSRQERVVVSNNDFVALVPFWAVWPYEILLLPRAHRPALPDLNHEERAALAAILQEIVARYDRLFQTPFPYSMGFHQQPWDEAHPEWHLHAHYYPPLLRSAAVPKFMVGYELLSQPQRDLTPELAARQLREVS
jgi:UDPglucose--hexose-1-phosphate uridylyltransferase